jgi:hypothetical protein
MPDFNFNYHNQIDVQDNINFKFGEHTLKPCTHTILTKIDSSYNSLVYGVRVLGVSS